MANLFAKTFAALSAIALVSVAGIPVFTGPSLDPLKIYSSPGGAIFEFIGQYNQIRDEGRTVEIRGVCASACTFFLGLVPKEKVCYDQKAYLGFHGVYTGGGFAPMEFNQPLTEWTYNYTYTPEVIKKLNELGWSVKHDVDPAEHPTGLIWEGPEFMKSLGYKECAN